MTPRTTHTRRSLSVTLTLALFAQLLCQGAVLAQSDQSQVTGTVRDQSKAVIPAAKVTAKNERTGEERTVNTDEQGHYLITNLKPSLYTIRVSASGFVDSEVTGVQLLVGQTLTSVRKMVLVK